MRRIAVLLGAVALLAAGGALFATPANAGDEPHKVFVCKYVGTPGVDETLQTGENPISVDISSLPNFSGIGSFFADAQGRSVAIAFDTGQPEPGVDECPPPVGPPPVDVCPNLDGDQATLPEGYHFAEDENGRTICVPNPPPDVFAATAQCDEEEGVFDVSGTVNGQPGTVNPTEIAGNFEGDTSVTVSLDQKSGQATVHTDGECGGGGTPRGVATAGAVCNESTHQYDVSGEVDGVPASVLPTTIPGGTNGSTLVAVFLDVEDVQLVIVNTAGTCVAPPPPPGGHEVTGAAQVSCVLNLYRVTGSIDGQTADSVNPATIPGSTKGTTSVTVTRGDTSFRTTVTTNGDCGPSSGTTVSTASVTTPPVATPAPPAATPVKPAVKPKPKPTRKPAAKPKPKPKHKAPPKKKPQKAPHTLGL